MPFKSAVCPHCKGDGHCRCCRCVTREEWARGCCASCGGTGVVDATNGVDSDEDSEHD